MQLNLINPWAVLAAALSSFLVGGLWYSPLLFGETWMRANGFSDLPRGKEGRIFALSFLFALVMALNLACFLAAPGTTLLWGAAAGGLAGVGWVAMAFGIVALFERRSWRWILINAGQQVIALILMGMILGAWRN